ncbi:MAG: DNA-3-methyladenine glycosylase 2 family protein [SAR202 cluster bacterium]|nr:DNA-3-methyladenine glycosylase 2 family protein [SAR202 cluster bacterium]
MTGAPPGQQQPAAAFILKPVAPFDIQRTGGYLSNVGGRAGADGLQDGAYWRLLDLEGKLTLASVRSLGSLAAPELEVELWGSALSQEEQQTAAAQLSWQLGTEQDLTAFYELAQSDPAMAGLTQQFYGQHLPHVASVFEALVLAVIGQQVTTHLARAIRTLLVQTYGRQFSFAGDTFYAFPKPEALLAASVEELRGLKLSQRKAEYIQGLAQAALEPNGGLDSLEALPDTAVLERLTALRGVGIWTAQWAMVRALGRMDVFPTGDLALRRAALQLYGPEYAHEKRLEAFSRRWSPWRTYATLYLFTALREGMTGGKK